MDVERGVGSDDRRSGPSRRLRVRGGGVLGDTVGGTEASILEPTLSGGELMYSGDLSSPGQTSTLSFAIRPTGLYSSGQGGTGSTTVTTNGKSVSADYTVTVRDPFAASGSDGVVLDFDTLYVQEITDFDIDADSGCGRSQRSGSISAPATHLAVCSR